MEDVWKDITTLPSFHPPITPNPNPTHHGMILRDFLTSPSAAGDLPPTSGEASTPAPASGFLFARAGPCHGSSMTTPFGATADSSAAYLLDSFMKKRSSEDNDGAGDRKYNRMMKNRASAARSRARKTAYTFELEKERNQLMAENERLRKVLQEQQLLTAAAGTEVEKGAPKKRNRIRSMSAPF